jgi:hypothetical protein
MRMRTKIKTVALCLLFTSLIISCKKEVIGNVENTANTETTYVAVLSQVLTDNQSTYEYAYNDLNLVTQEKSKFDYIVQNYNSAGQLTTTEYYSNDDILSPDQQVSQAAINSDVWVTPVNGIKNGLVSYEYNADARLIKTTYSKPSTTSSEYSDYSYDSNNRITRQTMYWENTVTGYIDYTYDSKGNLTKEALFSFSSSGGGELITDVQYSFDNENNPYKSTSRLLVPGINTNLNNIIKETRTVHLPSGQGSDNIQVTENSYEYNAMGYPVSKNGNVSYVYKM